MNDAEAEQLKMEGTFHEHRFDEDNRNLLAPVKVREGGNEIMVAPPQQVTPAQARIESVAAALDAAYKNASTLKLTPEEAKALEEDFPDEAFRRGAGGDENLIFIEHAYLRQRLNKVLGVGAATPIRRREWAEEFTYFKDGKNKIGVRVYVDLALIVRGCLVGEAIGDAVYYPDNAKTTYSDALESAKSNAFRRTCKEFGCGLQAWMKGWCEGWKERNGSGRGRAPQPTSRPQPPVQTAPRAAQTPRMATVAPKPASSEDVLLKAATKATRTFAMQELSQLYSLEDIGNFLKAKGWLDGTNEWNLPNVPTSKAEIAKIASEIGKWLGGEELPSEDEDELPPEISNVFIHVPPRGMKKPEYESRGMDTIGCLYARRHDDEAARNRLFGFMEKFEAKGWTRESDGKKFPPSEQDIQLRAALDELREWIEEKEARGESYVTPTGNTP